MFEGIANEGPRWLGIEKPGWLGPAKAALLIVSVVAVAAIIGPLFDGHTIPPGGPGHPIRLVARQSLYNDCEVQRAVQILCYVYKPWNYYFRMTTKTDAKGNDLLPTVQECKDNSLIYLGDPPATGPAYSSRLTNGCRVTGINPDHRDFSKRSLAHEFGHHRFGDVDAPGWLTIFNAFADIRNNFIIRIGL